MRLFFMLATAVCLAATVDGEELTHASQIALRSDHGYLSAQDDGHLVADRGQIGAWERFGLLRTPIGPGGTIHYGQQLRMRSSHRRWLAGEEQGGAKADREAAGDWEIWTIHDTANMESTEPVGCGHRVALQSFHGKYLVSEEGGVVKADRTAVGAWETWTLECVRRAPMPVQQLADLPYDTGFVARNLQTGKFLRAEGDYLLATSDFDEATPLAMGQAYNSRITNVFTELQYYSWNQSNSFRVFALRTADGADVVPHEQSLGLAFGLVTGVGPQLVASASLIRQESPGRFSVWVFDLGWDKHIYSLIACDTPYGCGRPRMPKPTPQEDKILYGGGADSGTGDWELYPVQVNVDVATPPDPRYAKLPKVKQITAFDGAKSLNLGTHSLPPAFAIDIYARIDQSQQWDHLIEVGTIEHEWNGPLRLEVGQEGEWYVSVGDGTRYAEATFDGGWSYGEDLHIRFRYDSNTGSGMFEQYDASSGGFRQLGTITGGPDVTDVEGTAIIGSMEGTSRFFRGSISALEVYQTFD